MSAANRPGRVDPDDWFADLNEVVEEREADSHPPATSPPSSARRRRGIADHWLDPQLEPADPAAQVVRSTRKRGALTGVAAAALVMIVLLIGLALLGVFSRDAEHSPTAAAGTTTSSSTKTVSTAPQVTGPRVKVRSFPVPTVTLRPGDAGAQVRLLQRALVRLGYLKGNADGVYGASTTDALTALQRVALLSADGILGPRTLRALRRALEQALRASPSR